MQKVEVEIGVELRYYLRDSSKFSERCLQVYNSTVSEVTHKVSKLFGYKGFYRELEMGEMTPVVQLISYR